MAVKLKTLKIPTYNVNILERKEYLKVNELFGLLKHKQPTRILTGNIKGYQIKLLNWSVYSNNYIKNNNVCKCAICGAKAKYTAIVKMLDGNDYTFRFFTIKNGIETMFNIDHIIPKSKGGSDKVDNLQVTCVDCNERKSNKVTKVNNVSKSISNKNNVAQQCSITSKPTMFQNNIYKIKNVGPGIVWNCSLEYVSL